MTAAAASSAAAAAPGRGRGAPVRRREGEGGEQLFDGGALAGGAGHGLAPGTHVPLERLVAFPAAVLVERHRLAGLQHAEGGRFPDLLEAREKDLHGRFPLSSPLSHLSTTGLRSTPIPSTSTSTWSPAARGSIPVGVPVEMISPGRTSGAHSFDRVGRRARIARLVQGHEAGEVDDPPPRGLV